MNAGLRLVVAAAVVGAVFGAASPAAAQPPTVTPVVPGGPPISMAGKWSITRSYWRSCPRCGTVIIRTVPWVITQNGADVRIDRGLRGTITGSGPALLSLTGTESGGFDAQRFWYATIRVAADGRNFEGGFDGSETISNPCGSDPPAVTCFVSAGWVRGTLVEAAPGAPKATSTATPVPTATYTPRPLPPVKVKYPPGPTAVATGIYSHGSSNESPGVGYP